MNPATTLRNLILGLVVSITPSMYGPTALAACIGGAPNGVVQDGEECDVGTASNVCCTSECTVLDSTDPKCTVSLSTLSCPAPTQKVYARIYYDNNLNDKKDDGEATLLTVSGSPGAPICGVLVDGSKGPCTLKLQFTDTDLVPLKTEGDLQSFTTFFTSDYLLSRYNGEHYTTFIDDDNFTGEFKNPQGTERVTLSLDKAPSESMIILFESSRLQREFFTARLIDHDVYTANYRSLNAQGYFDTTLTEQFRLNTGGAVPEPYYFGICISPDGDC